MDCSCGVALCSVGLCVYYDVWGNNVSIGRGESILGFSPFEGIVR